MSFSVLHNTAKLSQIETATQIAFSKVKDELDEHLDAINANTEENQLNIARIRDLEGKFDKLSEKMDVIIELIHGKQTCALTFEEQKVFAILYLSGEALSSRTISARAELPLYSVEKHLQAIQHKGVPLQANIVNHLLSYQLEESFRTQQAKENTLHIDERIMKMVTEN